MANADDIEQPGDPRHADHPKYLCELGRATYAAARLAGIAFDILRVFDQVASSAMYNDPLGGLLNRLNGFKRRQPSLPGLVGFIAQMDRARDTRNDLIHALPVKHGLHRRKSDDLGYVRNLFTVEDLRAVAEELEAVHRAGSSVLYHDGGAAVNAWYAAGGS